MHVHVTCFSSTVHWKIGLLCNPGRGCMYILKDITELATSGASCSPAWCESGSKRKLSSALCSSLWDALSNQAVKREAVAWNPRGLRTFKWKKDDAFFCSASRAVVHVACSSSRAARTLTSSDARQDTSQEGEHWKTHVEVDLLWWLCGLMLYPNNHFNL